MGLGWAGLLDGNDCDLGFDGIGDVALLVGKVMEVGFFPGGGAFPAGVGDGGVKSDEGDPGDAALVLGHLAGGLIVIGGDVEALAAGEVEEGEHVATGEGGDEGFLGIDEGGIGKGRGEDGWGGGGGDDCAAIE